jgi:predicted secreted acid phosphatase
VRLVGSVMCIRDMFKATKRSEIVEQGYTIVLNMGDQLSDLEGGYAERTFKLPNPFYWIP